ncbi:MAG: GIDE domain-containing protein [Myxococcaceae bacterium]
MGVLLLLIGLAVLIFGLTQHFKGKRILAAPFKKTGEIAKDPTSPDPKGAMSTEGAAIAETPLLSPCSKTPCLAYEVEIQREWEKQEQTQDGVKTKSGSTKEESLKQGMTFKLDDGTGPIPVDCSKADVSDFDTTKSQFTEKVKIGAFVPGELVFGQLKMQTPSLPSGERTLAFKATEKIVPVGGNYFVLGKLENGTLGKPGWRSMMFSSKGRDGLLASTAKKKKFSFIGGGVAAVASIPIMIFAPSAPSNRCPSDIAGVVARCKDNVDSKSGNSYSWKVPAAGNYQLAVIPPEGKKFPLDPQLLITNEKGETVVDATASSMGMRASASQEFQPGTYKVTVKDINGTTVKGGFDYDLEILGEGGAAAAVAQGEEGAPAGEEGKAAEGAAAPAGNSDELAAGDPLATLDAPLFLAEYLKGKPAADTKFAGKTVVLKGLVSSVDKDVDDHQYVVFDPGLAFAAQAFFPPETEKQAQALKVDRLATVKCRVRAQGYNLEMPDANILLEGCTVEAPAGKNVASVKAAAKKPAKKKGK